MRPSKCKALLIDINGVLYNTSANKHFEVIDGSVEAIKKLIKHNFPFLLLTNESQVPPNKIHEALNSLGFPLDYNQIFSSTMAIKDIIDSEQLKPYFTHYDIEQCDSVVITDAHRNFQFDVLNDAFKFLISRKEARFISAGKGKYYRDSNSELVLDLGPFTEALEFASGKKAEIVGKPSEVFFKSALKKLNSSPDQTFMIGDDIVSDVGGAQSAGMSGVLVRSGKYRPEDENHPTVKPDLIVDSIKVFVESLALDP